MKKKSIVLLSGGLDSVVNFKKALDETEVSIILNFDYFQISREKELISSESISKIYNIKFINIKLNWFENFNITLKNGNIPIFDKNKLDNFEYSKITAQNVWVPNRNGVFINIAASIAEYNKIDYIIVGFNKEEAQTFKDNSIDFINAINDSLKYSCDYPVSVKCYTSDLNKSEIVKLGLEIKAPFQFIWSCYKNENKMCGECESCQRLKRALINNNFYDEFNKINIWGFKI